MLSGREIVALLRAAGFEIRASEGKSGHFQLKKAGHPNLVSVPKHRQIAAGTLRQIIRSAGLSKSDFLAFRRGE